MVQVLLFTAFKAAQLCNKQYSFGNKAQSCTHTDTHPLKHKVRSSKFLSKWHTGRAPLCFSGRAAPESQSSRLDAPVERWVFQEKSCSKNQIAHPSEGGSRSDLPFITSLTRPTYGQQHTGHSGPVRQALIQNSNSKPPSLLSCRLPLK